MKKKNKEKIFCLPKNKFKFFNSFDECLFFKICLEKNFLILKSIFEKIEVKILIKKRNLYFPFIIEKYAKRNTEFVFRKNLFKNFLNLVEDSLEEKINLSLKKENDKFIFFFQNFSNEINVKLISYKNIQYYDDDSISENEIFTEKNNFENEKLNKIFEDKKNLKEDKEGLVKTGKKSFLSEISNIKNKKENFIFGDFYSSSEYSCSDD